jgi:cell cycle checkpoint protein
LFTHHLNRFTLIVGIWCFAVIDFIDSEAVDDAWAVVSYLSEADCLLTASPIASYNSENIAQLIAASVAARGVLFGNAHVTSSRYLDRQHYFIWQS